MSDRQLCAAELMVSGRDLRWLLSSWVQREPNNVFLIWAPFEGEDRQWTYAEFERDVRRLAAGLCGQGVKPGQRLLIHMENCPELLLAWFACAYLGVTGVLTNTRSLKDDIRYFCEHTEVVGALTQPQYAMLVLEAMPSLPFIGITADTTGEVAREEFNEVGLIAFEQLLTTEVFRTTQTADPMRDLSIQFTSGTTSRPKAVVWTHANALYAGQQIARNYNLQADDICHIVLPLFHTYALSISLMGALWAGGSVLLQRRFSARNFWRPAVQYGATWASLVPFCTNALKEHSVPEHRFRFWTLAVLPELEAIFRVPMLGLWGMTEMVSPPVASDPHHVGPRLSMGRPLPGTLLSIRRDDGSECGPGEIGDVYVKGFRGITIFKEYLNNPKANADSFDEDGWFRTGDRFRIGEEGQLYFADRAKDLLRVGGENVSAAQVEEVIMATGWIAECAVVGQPHPMLDEVPVAFVMPKPDAPVNLKDQLMAYCQHHLADFKTIRDVYIIKDFPRSTIGKIAKNKLRELLV